MDARTGLFLAVGGGAALAVALLSPVSPLTRKAGYVEAGQQGLTWAPSAPQGHHTRGGLFHPPECGQGRNALIAWGWDWIANPPGEAGLGVTQNA